MPLNILHISGVKSSINGIGAVLAVLAKEQRALGYDVRVITVSKTHLDDLGTEFISITNKEQFSFLVENFSPHIVIFHSVYFFKYIAFSAILKKKHIPYAIELHGALSKQNLQKHPFKKKIANILFYNQFIKDACTIIYLNVGEYENSIVKRVNNKSVIIPNGCYRPALADLSCNKVCKEKVEYVYLGRIELYHKALDILFDALEILQQEGYDKKIHFSFYGIGEGRDFIWFKNRIKSLSLIAEYRGPVWGNDKEKAFCEADIFVLTSKSEGMPIAVLEALSYGIPCILTPQTNMADVVFNAGAGWITDLSAECISRTIIKSSIEYRNNFNHYHLHSISLAAKYDWKKIAEQSVCLYEQMIMKDDF